MNIWIILSGLGGLAGVIVLIIRIVQKREIILSFLKRWLNYQIAYELFVILIFSKFGEKIFFSDHFDYPQELLFDKWGKTAGNGNPSIMSGNFKHKHVLKLSTSNDRFNSFVFIRDRKFKEGIISCDFKLHKRGVVNFCFFLDLNEVMSNKGSWFMARFDSRPEKECFDGILIKRHDDPNWHFMEGSRLKSKTQAGKWYRARVEFRKDKIRVFRNNVLIDEFCKPLHNENIPGECIGVFNEVDDAYIDNFKVI